MKVFRYAANNSGGEWWIAEDAWKRLEAAGWRVEWRNFLGAPAVEATKSFASEEDAIADWERATGANYDETGCECCGRPHYIYEERTP